MSYVELHCHSAYSFLDGASLPEELAARACELGYGALALTDHDGLYGSMEFAHAARALGVRPITGSEVTLATDPPSHVTLLVADATGYGNLCRLLTLAHRGDRLSPALAPRLLEEHADGLVCLSGCAGRGLGVLHPGLAAALAGRLGRDRFYIELQRPFLRGDTPRNRALRSLADRLAVRTVVTGNVHAHSSARTHLQDVLVAIREHTVLDGCEPARRGNAEFVLRSPAEMAGRFSGDREALRNTEELAERLEFDLTRELGYRYPDFSDGGRPAAAQLAGLCRSAFDERYRSAPHGLRSRALARLEEELGLIASLDLSGFFLLHWEVLELAREVAAAVRGGGFARSVLPPGRGRGSSVGSIVCYLTGLSHVDPVAADLPLGRFLNRELASVPDIDLDFPRDIRERLIPAVIERYGRDHAALVATFATYRSRGAIREVGKALGLPGVDLERLARLSDGWDARKVGSELELLPGTRERSSSPRWQAFPELCSEIAGLPRHVSQHPGGMVISTRPLVELVPVIPAAMEGRLLTQWDKDSCGDAGFLKIDLLGLGMLSAVEECVERVSRRSREPLDLSRIPLDDEGVYREIRAADTVGVFQIESRAQMQMLVRTLPRDLDDLTVEVALVRPGPIQGGAVHPYIERRRQMRDDPSYIPPYDHPLLEEPLRETLGVIVFQEQVLGVATALAGFTVGEAEGLRRAMSRRRSRDAIDSYRQRFTDGARARGVSAQTAEQVFEKLLGFAAFGFPKSHAAAFALLAYQSAWLRHHHPAAFLCALLNAQPMGFYPPASLVRDGQRRGVAVLPVDVNRSAPRCALEEQAVRVGLSFVKGLGERAAQALCGERDEHGPFGTVEEIARRVPVDRREIEALVSSGACDGFGLPRRELLWRAGLALRPGSGAGRDGHRQLTLPFLPQTEIPALAEQSDWERVLDSYRHTSLSLTVQPLELLRAHLPPGVLSSAELVRRGDGERVAVAGMVVARQRPATANGVVFMLVEDEYGHVNLVVPPSVYDRCRAAVRSELLVLARGRYEASGPNRNVVVTELVSLAAVARNAALGADVGAALPAAHSFGRP